jgi:hypothetical protein
VEKYVALAPRVNGAKKHSPNGQNGTGTKPAKAKAKASANGSAKKAAVKTSPAKTSSPVRKKGSKIEKKTPKKGKKGKGEK